LHPGRDRFDRVIAPAFQLRETRLSEGECRVELDCFFIKRLRPRQIVVPAIRPGENLVRLKIEEISLGVLGWFSFDPLLLARRERSLERRRNFLGEIGLDGKDIG
jgi:hypothetical protein